MSSDWLIFISLIYVKGLVGVSQPRGVWLYLGPTCGPSNCSMISTLSHPVPSFLLVKYAHK